MGIQSIINTTTTLDQQTIDKWESVLNNLVTNHIANTIRLDGALTYKYRFDFEGYLISQGINKEFIYPHIRANNFNSSQDYDGSVMDVVLLDNSILAEYLDLFNTK